MASFGQVVIGPPGAGKTTYCAAIKQFLEGMGRKVVIINLDPANDNLPYKAAMDISDLVTLTEVMDMLKLGPNGGLVYCMEFLEKNLTWLEEGIRPLVKDKCYFLFDCPGQVELFTHHQSVKNIVEYLQKLEFRLVAVHLVDSHYCNDASKFISVLLTSLSTMLQVGLPHVNVLSKIDLIEKYGKLPFNLDYFTEVLDLDFLLDQFKDEPSVRRYKKLNEALIGLVQDYGLVSFSTLHVESKQSMKTLMAQVDKANGYVYGGLSEVSNDVMSMMSTAVGADFQFDRTGLTQERYMKDDEPLTAEELDEQLMNQLMTQQRRLKEGDAQRRTKKEGDGQQGSSSASTNPVEGFMDLG